MAAGKERIHKIAPPIEACTAGRSRRTLLHGFVIGIALLSCFLAGCVNIDSDFESSVQTGAAPLTVHFTEKTKCGEDHHPCGCLSGSWLYNWDFNYDYKIRDVEAQGCSVTHTFTEPGTYTVMLFMQQREGTIIIPTYSTITVTETPTAPVADFTSSIRTGQAPLTVIFTDKSAGTAPFTYEWDFDNDGTVDSHLQDPTFIYPSPGVYTVKLTVSGAGGSDNEIKAGHITVTESPVPPFADFSASVQTGKAPLTVAFSDLSTGTGPLSYHWDFDSDDTVDSHLQNPAFTYILPGIYTVTQVVSGPGGSDTEIRTNSIIVTGGPAAPTVDFRSNVQSGEAPLTVEFTDRSTGTGPFTYYWDFDNDDIVDSSLKDPAFTYTSPGSYTVTEAVTSDGGSDYKVRINYITVTSGQSIPEFPTIFLPAVLIFGILAAVLLIRRTREN